MVVADHSQSAITELSDAAAALDGPAHLPRRAAVRAPRPCESRWPRRTGSRWPTAARRPGVGRPRSRARCSISRPPTCDASERRLVRRPRGGGELRFRRGPGTPTRAATAFTVEGDADLLPEPGTPTRSSGSRACSTAPTRGTCDRVGRAGLRVLRRRRRPPRRRRQPRLAARAEDSLVPLITAGFDGGMQLAEQPSITDLAPLTAAPLRGGIAGVPDRGRSSRRWRAASSGVRAQDMRRFHLAVRRPDNWFSCIRYCVVGATGYAVNLAVFAIADRWWRYQLAFALAFAAGRHQQLRVEPAVDVSRHTRCAPPPVRPLPDRVARWRSVVDLVVLRRWWRSGGMAGCRPRRSPS